MSKTSMPELIMFDESLGIRARIDDLGRVILPREVTREMKLSLDQNVALRIGTMENGRKCLVISPHLHLDEFMVNCKKTMSAMTETLRENGSKVDVALFDQTGSILLPSTDFLYNHRDYETILTDAVNTALLKKDTKAVYKNIAKTMVCAVPIFQKHEPRAIGALVAIGNQNEVAAAQMALQFAAVALTKEG